MKHYRWTKTGRLFSHADEGKPNTYTFKSRVGQVNADLGGGDYAPYVWDALNRRIIYGLHSCTFFDGYQVVRGGDGNVLIDDQRFEVQYWSTQAGGSWRVLDLFNQELTATQQDDHCIVTRRLYDGQGNELRVDFLFRPSHKVKLTFTLTVASANRYRVRVQNSGIAGDATELRHRTMSGTDIGQAGYLFEKIWWKWSPEEIGIHSATVETQAQGKKLDIFLGPFDLQASGSIIVSPDVWGSDVGIASNEDDGEERNNTNWYASNEWIYVGYSANMSETDHIGLRWTNITIPQGSTIDTTIIDIYVTASGSSGTATFNVQAWDTDNAGQFSSTDRPSTVTRTTASVAKSVPAPGSDSWVNLSGLQSVVEEIIGRTGWSSGNAINFTLMNTASSGENYIGVEDYISTGTNEAELTITYTSGGGAPAISLVSGSPTYATSTGATSLACNKPSGVQEGDLMIAFVFIENNSDIINSVPSGWTQVHNNTVGARAIRLYTYKKVATGSESSSYTWGSSTSTEWVIQIAAFRGASGVGNTSVSTSTSASTSCTAPSINVQNAGNWVLHLCGNAYGTTYTPSSNPAYTEIGDYRSGTGSGNISAEWSYREYSAAGSTGNITATAANSDYFIAALLELRVSLLAVTDSGSGSDAATVTAGLSVQDAGSGSDAATVTAGLSVQDAGSGVDSLSVQIGETVVTVTDGAYGQDALTGLSVSLALSDGGSGAEGLGDGLQANVPLSDSGAGVDALSQILAGLTVSDSGQGADAATSLILISVSDAGGGADGLYEVLVQSAVADSAAGADIVSQITAALSVSDSGQGADSAVALILIAVSDAGSCADGTLGISTAFAIADSGQGTETPAILASFALGDAGTGADLVSIIQEALKSIADTGVGFDSVSSIFVIVPVGDTGTGVDLTGLISSLVSIVDSGQGVDIAIRYTDMDVFKKLLVTFTGKKAGIGITGKKATITFTGKKPSIDFDA